MIDSKNSRVWVAIAFLQASFTSLTSVRADDAWSVAGLAENSGKIEIHLQGKPFATFSYRDPKISRPYFANIFTPQGIKVTRNHPPQAGDKQDHDLMHPGIWLAFGDLSGSDFWRLKAPVTQLRFLELPKVQEDQLRFMVENDYSTSDGGASICRETCGYTFKSTSNGVFLNWDSSFKSAEQEFAFGDQEEMGLGIRLASPFAVDSQQGGRILNSAGELNGKEVWGKQAEWCDYSGTSDGKFVGIMLIPDSRNFGKSWFHARDYGFVAANPFGRKVFTKGEISRVRVERDSELHLRFTLFIHWNDRAAEFDPADAMKHAVAVGKR